jgi:hypothetical protein
MNKNVILIAWLLTIWAGGVSGDATQVTAGSDYIPLTAERPYLYVAHGGKSIKVERLQDPDYEIKGYYAKTARKCPPFCLQPAQADIRVETIGEVELFAFMGAIDGLSLVSQFAISSSPRHRRHRFAER